MSRPNRAGAFRQITTLYHLGPVSGLTDGQLLAIFVDRRDPAVAESAFAALVERHGPMVLRVCRQSLNPHDAEDAFQATFLVLSRRASSIRRADSLASWLFGVSRRLAHRSARQITRQRLAEHQAAERRPELRPDPSTLAPDALLHALDQLPGATEPPSSSATSKALPTSRPPTASAAPSAPSRPVSSEVATASRPVSSVRASPPSSPPPPGPPQPRPPSPSR